MDLLANVALSGGLQQLGGTKREREEGPISAPVPAPSGQESSALAAHSAQHKANSRETSTDDAILEEPASPAASPGPEEAAAAAATSTEPAPHRGGKQLLLFHCAGGPMAAVMVSREHVGRLMTPEEKREHLRATLPTKLAMEVESIEGGRIACPCCMKAFQQASRQGDEDLYVKSSGREASIRQMIRDKHVVKLAIRHHPEKGRILVAVEDIPEGTFIMEYGGQLISGEEAVRREAAYNHAGCGSYMYFFEHNGRQHCVDATAEISSYGKGRLLSHSRAHQNLRPGKTTMLGVPRLYFTASQHIPAGTELQYDYGERDAKVVEQLKWLAE